VTDAPAHDGLPNRPPRGQDGADALGVLLRRAVDCARGNAASGDGAAREAAMRASLATACARARADGLRAEQVLVRLKGAWADVREAPRAVLDVRAGVPGTLHLPTRMPDSAHDHDRLARVVTLCIEEFYRGDGAGRGAQGEAEQAARRAEEARRA
jgi:hypothetical protein